MEYFSEIGNEEVDDDSLFDPQNNFLGQQKTPNPDPADHVFQLNPNLPKKKDTLCSQKV